MLLPPKDTLTVVNIGSCSLAPAVVFQAERALLKKVMALLQFEAGTGVAAQRSATKKWKMISLLDPLESGKDVDEIVEVSA